MYMLRMSNSIQFATSPLKPMPLKEERGLQEDESSSSSSSSLSSKVVDNEEPVQVKSDCHVDDGEGDDGYHTPTSPSHRIQAAANCPPAPKKPTVPRRYKKRKAYRLIEIKDFELVFCSETDVESKRCKKDRYQ